MQSANAEVESVSDLSNSGYDEASSLTLVTASQGVRVANSTDYHGDYHQSRMPTLPLAEAAQGASTNASNANHLSHTMEQAEQQEIRQAIYESQAAHIAHTREQIKQDIRFRRTLERVLVDVNNDPQRAVLKSQKTPKGDDADLVRTIHQSIIDEPQRDTMAEKYARSLEIALSQSEELASQRREMEAQDSVPEEELLQEVIKQSLETAADDEKRTQNTEEELLEEVMAQSLAEEAANKEALMRYEEEQLRLALAQSVGEEVKSSDGEDTNSEDIIEKALKMSLEEIAHISEEERELVEKVTEWSKSET